MTRRGPARRPLIGPLNLKGQVPDFSQPKWREESYFSSRSLFSLVFQRRPAGVITPPPSLARRVTALAAELTSTIIVLFVFPSLNVNQLIEVKTFIC